MKSYNFPRREIEKYHDRKGIINSNKIYKGAIDEKNKVLISTESVEIKPSFFSSMAPLIV